MNNKSLLLTLGAAVVVGGIGIAMYDAQQGSQDLASELVLPGLSANAGNIERIKIVSAGEQLVVQSHKSEGKWLIDNFGNYVADTGPLSKLINNLKDAKKVEAKTAKPEHFHHLGLRDISDEQSKAMLVTVSTKDKSFDLLIGDSAKQGTGQYVRLAGDNQTWLIDKAINKPDQAEDWIDTKLFDFDVKDIQSLTLSGQFEYVLSKENAEQQNYQLQQIPENYSLKYDSIVDSVPRAVANLKFDSLINGTEHQSNASQQIAVKLFDDKGEVNLALSKVEDAYFVKLTGQNPLWDKWVYQISEFQFNQLVKDKMEFLNEDKPEGQETP